MVANYLLDIVFLLAAAMVAVPAFRAIGLGIVPGFLVAGVLVGPSGLALRMVMARVLAARKDHEKAQGLLDGVRDLAEDLGRPSLAAQAEALKNFGI